MTVLKCKKVQRDHLIILKKDNMYGSVTSKTYDIIKLIHFLLWKKKCMNKTKFSKLFKIGQIINIIQIKTNFLNYLMMSQSHHLRKRSA